MKAGGHGAVQGVLPDEIQSPAAQGIDLIADKDVSGAGKGKKQLAVVMKVQPAHVPGVVVIQLQVKFHVCHRIEALQIRRYQLLLAIVPRQENICKLFAKLQIDLI